MFASSLLLHQRVAALLESCANAHRIVTPSRKAGVFSSTLQPRKLVSTLVCHRNTLTALQVVHCPPLSTAQRLFSTARCCLARSTTKATAPRAQPRRRASNANTPSSCRRPTKKVEKRRGAPKRMTARRTSSPPTGNVKAPVLATFTRASCAQSHTNEVLSRKDEAGISSKHADEDDTAHVALLSRRLPQKDNRSASNKGEQSEGVSLLNATRYWRRSVTDTADLSLVDRIEALIKIPDINTVDLHNADIISEDMMSSIQGRSLVFKHLTTLELGEQSKQADVLLKKLKGRVIGASLYVRVVHRDDVRVFSVDAGATPLSVAQARKCSLAAARSASYTREVKKLRDEIERVLRRYVSRLIEPFPNELAIDLTHYGTFLALLNTGRRNVEQFVKDANDFIAQRPVNPEGIPAGPPPAKDTEPISPDVLAAEIARLIRHEVLLPRCGNAGSRRNTVDNTEADDEDGERGGAAAAATLHVPRVCIGVASSPVLAKIACDAEVAVVLTRLRDVGSQKESGAGDRKNGEWVPLVSVRSLYRHTRSSSAAQEFVKTLPVAQVPLFTPAFVELLRRVFEVRTCGDLLRKRVLLCFCFSSATALACLCAACGQMFFPVEEKVALVAMANLLHSCGAVRVLASNAITLVNAQRTKFAVSIENITRDTFKFQIRDLVACSFSYGRLNTDEELIQITLSNLEQSYTKLHCKGFTFAGFLCAMSEDKIVTFSFQIASQPNLSREELLRVVKPQLAPMLQHRKGRGADTEGALLLVSLSFHKVEPILMVPPAMVDEADELLEAVLYTKTRIKKCGWVAQTRKRTNKLLRKKDEKGKGSAEEEADAEIEEEEEEEAEAASGNAVIEVVVV